MSDTPSELSAPFPRAEEDNTPQPAASSRGSRSPAGTIDTTKRMAAARRREPLCLQVPCKPPLSPTVINDYRAERTY